MSNSESTFEEVLEEHSALIRKVCHFYADTEQDFEDNVQEVALQLWKSFPTFEGRSKLSTWIYRVALNVCLSQLRREKKRPQTTTLPPQVKSEHKNNHEYSERKKGSIQPSRNSENWTGRSSSNSWMDLPTGRSQKLWVFQYPMSV